MPGKQDIHEADLSFQERVRQEYLDLVRTEIGFEVVECFNESLQMLPPAEIFDKILNKLKTHLIID